jgi:hypothetical protein
MAASACLAEARSVKAGDALPDMPPPRSPPPILRFCRPLSVLAGPHPRSLRLDSLRFRLR